MDDKLLQIFAEESWELIESLEDGLVNLEQDADPENLNAIFRAAHTMKGNAGIVGFNDVLDLTHLMEGVLDEMRKGRRRPEKRTVDLLLSAVDALKILIASHLEGREAQPPTELISALGRLMEGESPPAVQPAPEQQEGHHHEQEGEPCLYKVTMRFDQDLFTTGNDPLLLLLELGDLGEIKQVMCHSEDLPPFERLDPSKLYLWWEVLIESREAKSRLDNVFIFVQDDNDITIQKTTEQSLPKTRTVPAKAEPKPDNEPSRPEEKPRPSQTPPAPSGKAQARPPATQPTTKPAVAARALQTVPTIRVDTDKLDKLVNMVGELVISVARVSQLTDGDEAPEMEAAVEALEHVSRDLQEQIMRVRMVPVEATFNRFQRVVRDLASELGKKIKLEMLGAETELDKNVIEQIADPLKHLVRNSADHGLEKPAERLAEGKPETGTITLRAYQQEGRIIIEVSDDGRGIDKEALLKKAIDQCIVAPGTHVGDNELLSFIFLPGFSTAAHVTEVSGRGVGLDVVKRNIESLSGSLEIDTETGQGTTFRVKLPLTLAIIDGMMVTVGDEVITLPVLSILESIRPRPEDIRTVEGQGELIAVRGEYLPLVRLYEVLQMPTQRTDPTDALVVIIESVARRFGILVDDILGEQQAVIKSLEQNYRKIDGVAGATILGDGRVSLILDIHGLEKLSFA